MKKLSILLAMVLCMTAICVLVSACGGPGGGGLGGNGEFSITASAMDKINTNIVGADALAIVDAKTLNSSNPVAYAGLGRPQTAYAEGTDDALVLGKVDENGNLSEVKMQDEQQNFTLTAGDLNAEVYKMKVIGNFTIVAYISPEIRNKVEPTKVSYSEFFGSYGKISFDYIGEEDDFYLYCYAEKNFRPWDNVYTGNLADGFYRGNTEEDGRSIIGYDILEYTLIDRTKGVWQGFDSIGYFSNHFMQSYAIDNTTGKMYSLADLPSFDIVNNMLAVRDRDNRMPATFYRISVNSQGNLVLEDVMPNKEIAVYAAHTDAYDWTYVWNSMTTETHADKKTVYIKDNTDYYFDEQNYAYVVEKETNPQTGMDHITSYKRFVDGVPTEVEDTNIVLTYLQQPNTQEWNPQFSLPRKIALYNGKRIDLSWGKENYLSEGNRFELGFEGVNYDTNQYGEPMIFFLGDNYEYYVCMSNSNVYYAHIDWDDFDAKFAEAKTNMPEHFEWGNDFYYTLQPTQLLANAVAKNFYCLVNNELTVIQGYAVMSLTGTQNYMVEVDEQTGEAKAVLVDATNYVSDYFVIEPLN